MPRRSTHTSTRRPAVHVRSNRGKRVRYLWACFALLLVGVACLQLGINVAHTKGTDMANMLQRAVFPVDFPSSPAAALTQRYQNLPAAPKTQEVGDYLQLEGKGERSFESDGGGGGATAPAESTMPTSAGDSTRTGTEEGEGEGEEGISKNVIAVAEALAKEILHDESGIEVASRSVRADDEHDESTILMEHEAWGTDNQKAGRRTQGVLQASTMTSTSSQANHGDRTLKSKGSRKSADASHQEKQRRGKYRYKSEAKAERGWHLSNVQDESASSPITPSLSIPPPTPQARGGSLSLNTIIPPLGTDNDDALNVRKAHGAIGDAAAAALSASERAQAKRDRLISQIRASKPGGSERKRLIARWNTFMPARNAGTYPKPSATSIPILILLSETTPYLESTLRLFDRVKGINSTTLVASHQSTNKAVWKLVESVRFCQVRQLLFPGAHGRGAAKLHFAFALSRLFGQLEAPSVLVMEDDHWPTPDLYSFAVWMLRFSARRAPRRLDGSLPKRRAVAQRGSPGTALPTLRWMQPSSAGGAAHTIPNLASHHAECTPVLR
jgi:hypothetical protein